MTKKHFTVDNRYVMQNDETYVACANEHSADVVATALNELLDENEQLKQENKELRMSPRVDVNEIESLVCENGQLKSALKELKQIGDYQTNHIKELQEEIRPIQDICKKYKIPLEDLPDVLEEYITLDNEEYEEKLREKTI